MAVPVLVYAAGLSPKAAIATSLLVVGATAAASLIDHHRRGNVLWKTGLLFSSSAMVGAYGGGFAANWFEGKTLLLLFAGMMVVTAIAMLRPKKGDPKPPTKNAPIWIALAEGLVVGGFTGLVGAGGGFLVVPALVLLGGMDMRKAVGTSLLVITLKSFAAFAGHATHGAVDYQLAMGVTAMAVGGSFIGSIISRKLDASKLKTIFGWFVLAMAAFVIWKEAGSIF